MANINEKCKKAEKLLKEYTAIFISGKINPSEFIDNYTEDLRNIKCGSDQMSYWINKAVQVIKEQSEFLNGFKEDEKFKEIKITEKRIQYVKKYIKNRLEEGKRLEDILKDLKINKQEIIINIIGYKEYLKILEAEEENVPDGEWTKLKAQINPNIIDELFQMYEEEKITLKELKLKIKKVTGYG
jgi:hypothetical protein